MRPLRILLALALLAPLGRAQTVLFQEDFEGDLSRWSMTDLWHVEDAATPCVSAAAPFPSGTRCAWYGSPSTCTFETGNFDFQFLTCTQDIALPATSGALELRFRSLSSGEDDGVWDTRIPQVSNDGGATWSSLATVFSSSGWLVERFDISHYAGQTVRIRFQFWIGDGWVNWLLGWLVDDVQILEHAGPAVEFCFGDGTWYACPCGNSGGPGRGCATSFNPAGARLSASGSASLSADTLQLAADGMSTAAATFFQGTVFVHAFWSQPTFAGDGLGCFGGPFARIRTVPAPGGAASYPGPGEATVSVAGLIPAPWTTRYYAVRYRNAASFCTPATFNVTNSLQVTWRP